MNILTMNQITKSYTDKILFSKAEFSVAEGEKVGVIGINGAGKSTLLRIIAGVEVPDEGETVKGTKVIIKYLSQNPTFEAGLTIYDHVITRNIKKENEWMIEGEAKSILNKLGFSEYNTKIDNLSGGEKKRVALATVLLSTCDILILDEPTNHLDSEMAEWLEDYLNHRKGALIMVTHDRYFLDKICNRIVEIDKGKIYNYDGNYETYLELKAQREEMSVASERKRKSLLRTELEWMKRGARARSTKQKARIERYEELKDQKENAENERVLMSSVSKRLGKKTIELSHVEKSFDKKRVIQDFTYIFLKGDRIGIIGKNGCGKSTLMKVITGKILPDKGQVDLGLTVKIGYFSQENEYMDTSLKAIDYVKETAEYIQTNEGTITASKMLERFLFDSTLQYQQIHRLSGGEKRRLYLLKILMDAPNVLILDEPTNDLDIETLTILEEYLDGFDGIVITVSHDRYFLDRVVSRIFTLEEDGRITQYEGNYTDFQKSMEKSKTELKKEIKKDDSVELQLGAKKWKEQKVEKKKLKFSFQEQKDFETIDDEIEKLEQKVEELEQNIEKVATDFAKLNEYMKEKEEVEEILEEKMKRWMYLQDLAEKIYV